MRKTYYCPECLNALSEISSCASVSYFCEHCKKLVSRKVMIEKEERDEKAKEKEKQ